MVSDVLKVLEYLFKIVGNRKANKKKQFKELIEPLFNELLIIHKDYIAMFEETTRMLPGYHGTGWTKPGYNNTPDENSDEYIERLNNTIERLKLLRREFEPVRIKLRALNSELRKRNIGEAEEYFISQVVEYLPDSDSPNFESASTHILRRVQLEKNKSLNSLSQAEKDEIVLDQIFEKSIDKIQNHISIIIGHHIQKWSRVCECYAHLKVKYSTK